MMYRLARIGCAVTVLAAFAANAEAASPEDDLLAALVGKWQADGSADGKPAKGTLVFKWGESKSCVVSEYTVNHDGQLRRANHIVGFDSHTKSYRCLAFWSHGLMEDYHYTKGTDGVYRGVFAGSQDGQRFEGALSITVSKNSFKVETKGLTLAGDPAPELIVTFTRVNE